MPPTGSTTFTLGVATWNDEMAYFLVPSSTTGQPSIPKIKCRDHLGKILTDVEFNNARKALGFDNSTVDRQAVIALLNGLRTGTALDARIDQIIQEFGTTGGTTWTLALVSDRHVNGTIDYCFEVFKES